MDVRDARIIVHNESNRKFKIVIGKERIGLKCESYKERTQWVEALKKVTKGDI